MVNWLLKFLAHDNLQARRLFRLEQRSNVRQKSDEFVIRVTELLQNPEYTTINMTIQHEYTNMNTPN